MTCSSKVFLDRNSKIILFVMGENICECCSCFQYSVVNRGAIIYSSSAFFVGSGSRTETRWSQVIGQPHQCSTFFPLSKYLIYYLVYFPGKVDQASHISPEIDNRQRSICLSEVSTPTATTRTSLIQKQTIRTCCLLC